MRSESHPKTRADCKGCSFMAADENSHCMCPTQQTGIRKTIMVPQQLHSENTQYHLWFSPLGHFLEDWSPHFCLRTYTFPVLLTRKCFSFNIHAMPLGKDINFHNSLLKQRQFCALKTGVNWSMRTSTTHLKLFYSKNWDLRERQSKRRIPRLKKSFLRQESHCPQWNHLKNKINHLLLHRKELLLPLQVFENGC